MIPGVKNVVEKYDTPLINNGVIRFSDYVAGKFDDIHNQLYFDALEKFIDAQRLKEKSEKDSLAYSNTYKRIHTIIEYKNKDYFKPSYILVISKKRPYTKELHSLAPYWNKYYYENRVYVEHILENEKADNKHYEITDINYVKGTATLESKISGDTITVPIETLSEYNILSDDMLLTNIFG